MELILETSTLIHLYFGGSNYSKKIKELLVSYNKISISKIIRYEFRNIFLDFFRFIEIYKFIIQRIKNNEMNLSSGFSELLEEISRKFHRKEQQFGRMRMIYQNLLDDYQSKSMEIMIKGIIASENTKEILINRLESLIWSFKIKLKNIYSYIEEYDIIDDFDCALYKWKYYYNAKKDEFEINETRNCSQVCINIKERIWNFLNKNQNYIEQILENYFKITDTKDTSKYDKKLILFLNNISNNKEQKIGTRDCKILGDLFISSIIEKDRYILTRNESHFRFLLLCKTMEENLILI